MAQMNYEDFSKNLRDEEKARKGGVEQVIDLLEQDVSGQRFIDSLAEVTPEEFLLFFGRINAAVRGRTSDEVEFFPEQITVKTSDMSLLRETEFVFPRSADRKELMEQVASKVKELASQKDESSQRTLSRLLYNASIYLHVAPDGNGRSARLLYLATSPDIPKSPSVIRPLVEQGVMHRSSIINEYHKQLNKVIYQILLEKRNLTIESHDGDYASRIIDTPVLGFDGLYVQLLAAADVLSEEEKHQYNKSSYKNALAIDIFVIPESVRQRIDSQMNSVRREFVQTVLDLSSDPAQEWPDWLVEPLNKNFAMSEQV